MYKNIIRPIFFKCDAEKVHDFTLFILRYTPKCIFKVISKYTNLKKDSLKQKIDGIEYDNPFGLAAGMDKNALVYHGWEGMGFSHVEFGSVSHHKQPGNKKPRVFRDPKNKTIIVFYGLCNDGAKNIINRLKKYKGNLIKGLSIAKTTKIPNRESLEDDINDYLSSFKIAYDTANYLTLNISCPNVACFSDMQQEDLIHGICKTTTEYRKTQSIQKPIYLKISPDSFASKAEDLVEICFKYGINGVIATNLTKSKDIKEKIKDGDKGGISGKPLQKLSDEMIKKIYDLSKGKLTIIGCGGVFTAKDAYNKVALGSSLIHVATGFIYNGPLFIRTMQKDLDKLLKENGYKNIKELRGTMNILGK